MCGWRGPGSEILAFAKYYAEQEPDEQVAVSFVQIDRVAAWAENILLLKSALHQFYKKKFGKKSKWPASIDANFFALDVSKPKSFLKLVHTFKCDIVVMSYVISEIFDFKSFAPILDSIVKGKGKHTYVVITDRSDEKTKETTSNNNKLGA